MSPEARRIRLVLELRSGGITDTRVLSAMERVPRELFVPETFRDRATEDVALPIGRQQTVSQPSVVARMSQALEVGDRDKVLEVGTGSGYQSAVLCRLCRRLYTVERHPALLREAETRLAALALTNVTARVGDGTAGWPEQAPFDRIMVTAAGEDILEDLLAQVAVGGVMVAPVGIGERDQRLVRVCRTKDGADIEDLGAARFVPLVAGVEPE
ncbi:MAG: protein-L-isoaspartate(D-aspartate) O-methyltransferase [Rhodospirillales bacterium]|nr:protein-L-isoaspartate(D-aspartate) O-methyltransferase [Rhodospirillales bacterium]HJO71855.1 protein-L-isoaspartate(D-aspartate) O-methyltransferase [Rhodospirillales bacterium]